MGADGAARVSVDRFTRPVEGNERRNSSRSLDSRDARHFDLPSCAGSLCLAQVLVKVLEEAAAEPHRILISGRLGRFSMRPAARIGPGVPGATFTSGGSEQGLTPEPEGGAFTPRVLSAVLEWSGRGFRQLLSNFAIPPPHWAVGPQHYFGRKEALRSLVSTSESTPRTRKRRTPLQGKSLRNIIRL